MAATIATVQRMDPAISKPFEEAVGEALGISIERREMPMLAGPNHTIQILLDAADWARLGGAILLAYAATVFSKSFVERAGQIAADKVFKEAAQDGGGLNRDATEKLIERLLTHALDAQKASHSIVLGLPDVDNFRNVGIELPALSASAQEEAREKLIRIIGMLGSSASAIEAFLTADHEKGAPRRGGDEQNSDCSLRIRATAAGKLKIRFTDEDGNPMVASFDLKGCEIDAAPPPEDIDDHGNVINVPEEEL